MEEQNTDPQAPQPLRPPVRVQRPGRAKSTRSVPQTSPIPRWCMTLNNPTEAEIEKLNRFFQLNCKLCVYEIEHATPAAIEQGLTPHIQGFFVLKKPVRLSALKKINDRAHFETTRKSQKVNVDYCSKEYRDNPQVPYFTIGDFAAVDEKKQGQRTDLEKVIAENNTLAEVMENAPLLFCRYRSGLTAIMLQKEQNNVKPLPNTTWLWGPTGTGKTRHAIEFCESKGLKYWISGENLKWFDGYQGQPVAIIDDFRKGDCTFKFLLRLLDRYRLQVPIKGGFVAWVPEYIFITCPYEPRCYFQYKDEHGLVMEREDIGQLMRRITAVKHIGMPEPLILSAEMPQIYSDVRIDTQ